MARLPPWQQWVGLVLLSGLLGTGLEAASFPAALLIGPMLVAVAFGVFGASIRMPQPAFVVAQAVVACLVANSLSPEFLPAFMENWPVLVGSVVVTLVASSFLGWLISRWRILPGTTAVWGSAPGAASAMVLMAGAFGADQRLVAFMQYYRVILVTAAAAAIARLWVGESGVADIVWFPPLEVGPLAATAFVVAAGPWVGRLMRMPSPQFIGTMVLAFALKTGFGVSFHLPEWLLAASYAVVGWTIGLKFSRETISQIRRSLAQVTAAILALIVICGGIAFLLVELAGVDPLTAYLATSPGGMDSVAIIATAADGVDITFVMALQMLRFLIVLVLGPSMAKLVAGWVRT
ncbi:MAG: AbrB family transcriptional regulator [Rhizobiaceae bacterium]|nr:AbrB family transcriptional regulator [Rhizobiaceae bacterium]